MSHHNGPGSKQWQTLVAEGAGGLGLEITAAQIEILACHANELIKWNKKMNLTRISDPGEMAIKHYVDSLACVPYMPAGADILDIGSGGGFPGVPVAVVAQPKSVLMVDSVGKKISFLQHAIRLMGLKNAEARHVRAQELKGQTEYGEFFDRVICRALTGIDQIASLAFPLLKAGGMVVALKGRAARTEQECHRLAEKGNDFCERDSARMVTYRLPVANMERSLILIRK
ncbi:MAG: 16S rRNA (guanine(527)-N(7))-methyltransferase RsmG [Desulfobacterales bacterium]|nr:16S rRNA (guanine(527)-N(7))-methyltransferase RsmG [Desulfobacterales bacterium]